MSNVLVNVVLMKWFNSNMLAIIHLSIHNIKGRCIICIISKKLYCITIIQRLKHVIIDIDVCIFEILLFCVLMLHVADFGCSKFISLSHKMHQINSNYAAIHVNIFGINLISLWCVSWNTESWLIFFCAVQIMIATINTIIHNELQA